jgi:hypothetical protein
VPLVTYAGTTEAVEVPTLLTAGEAAEFLLLAKDTDGRPVPRGLDNFKMTFEGLVGGTRVFVWDKTGFRRWNYEEAHMNCELWPIPGIELNTRVKQLYSYQGFLFVVASYSTFSSY